MEVDRLDSNVVPRAKAAPGVLDVSTAPRGVEANGINAISQAARKRPRRDLFWPRFAGNVSVLGISGGAFRLGFGTSLAVRTLLLSHRTIRAGEALPLEAAGARR